MILAANSADTVAPEIQLAGWELLQEHEGWTAVAVSLVVLMVALTIWMYRRERHSVGGVTLAGLLALRLIAIAGVVAMLLGPERRTAETVTRPSKVVVLVDSSLSMALANSEIKPSELAESDRAKALDNRTTAAKRLLTDGGLLKQLLQTHQVHVAATSTASNSRLYGESSDQAEVTGDEDETPNETPKLDSSTLAEFIRPVDAQTRLAEAIDQTIEEFTGQPLAGIVLLTDGQNNAGPDPIAASANAAGRNVPLATIGFGPLKAGMNVIVRELIAPRRAIPGDEIELTASIELTGETPRPDAENTTLTLFRRLESEPEEAAVLLASETVGLKTGATKTVRFKVTPETAASYLYSVRAEPIKNETRLGDNRRRARVEVIDRETTVLLWAGGPGRDYQFLRNRLKRDDSFFVDVLLQSSSRAATQDARSVLQQFPETLDALDEYDVLVAIDPDWSVLSESQIDNVQQWMSRRGGGLYFAPGPVNTPRWSQRTTSETLKSILPVTLPDRLALLAPAAIDGNRKPVTAKITRAGGEAQYLWLTETGSTSNEAWESLPGFYRISQVASTKPGTTVLAETASTDGAKNTPLFAEQFYGVGRSFYSGTTELWRLRSENPDYFDRLSTGLLRHLAEGRLLAANRGGSLLFDRESYQLGDTLRLRAILPDAQHAEDLRADLVDPHGNASRVNLKKSEAEAGVWVTSLPGNIQGTYEAVLEMGAPTALTAQTEVAAPAAERDRPLRNVALLQEIASAGGGYYYTDPKEVAEGTSAAPPLADLFPSREESRLVYGKPDEQFALRWSQGLLAVICGSLFLEWLTRRLTRLA